MTSFLSVLERDNRNPSVEDGIFSHCISVLVSVCWDRNDSNGREMETVSGD